MCRLSRVRNVAARAASPRLTPTTRSTQAANYRLTSCDTRPQSRGQPDDPFWRTVVGSLRRRRSVHRGRRRRRGRLVIRRPVVVGVVVRAVGVGVVVRGTCIGIGASRCVISIPLGVVTAWHSARAPYGSDETIKGIAGESVLHICVECVALQLNLDTCGSGRHGEG